MKTYRLEVFHRTPNSPVLRLRDESEKVLDERPLDKPGLDQLLRLAQDESSRTGSDLLSLGRLLYEWADGRAQRCLEPHIKHPDGLALHISVEEKLRHLPWELMAAGSAYLCADSLAPFTPVRRVGGRARDVGAANRPLRVLLMATSPEDVEPLLDFEGEERRILQATAGQGPQGVELVVEESGTLEGLQFIVSAFGKGYFDVFHLTGHAYVDGTAPKFILESDLGLRRDATAEQIAGAFLGMWPRLIFLSGCMTGRAPLRGWLPSMSEKLVELGAPAVMGWALPVGDVSASYAASQLYFHLGTGLRTDEAVARARQKLWEHERSRHTTDWHLLRLYADATPLSGLVTPIYTPGRPPKQVRQASDEFLDDEGKSRVASREAFVGRRRLIQRCLRALTRPDTEGKVCDGLLLHGMGGLGKSTVAARVCERMSSTHQRVVWRGKIDEREMLGIATKVKFRDVGEVKEAIRIMNDRELDLATRLRYLLAGPMATLPCLFVFDDFEEGNLEPSSQGDYLVTPEANQVLMALSKAIRAAGSSSLAVIASRYTFPMPPGAVLHVEGLESIRDAELEKRIELLPALRRESKTPKDLRERAIGAAGGNHRLLEWMDRVLADPGTDHESLLAAMEP